MKMKHLVLATSLASLWVGTTFAQSTITLDSFDLDGSQAEVAQDANPAPEQSSENCLINPEALICEKTQSESQSFSLSDVVNLGIVTREEVEVENSEGEIVRVEDRVEALPSIDLEILFDYKSATLRPDQMTPLIQLSQDLAEIDFNQAQLVVMGHTDGAGSATYNRELSHRRAQSVAAFLSEVASIPLYRIKTSGMGFDYLKDTSDPEAAVNRRVQILLVK